MCTDATTSRATRPPSRAAGILKRSSMATTQQARTPHPRVDNNGAPGLGIAHHPLLTERQERRLAARARRGDADSRRRLIEHNMRLVYAIAAKYLPYTGGAITMDDLVHDGVIGLIRAVDKFDPRRGRLATYAAYWITQAITRSLARSSRLIRLPLHAHDRARLLARTRTAYQMAAGGDTPDLETLARAIGISPEMATAITRADATPASLQTPIGHGEADLGSLLSDSTSVEEIVETREITEAVRYMIDTLTPRQARIIQARYGFDGGQERTAESVARELGISRERVKQIENRALAKLRTIASRKLLGYEPAVRRPDTPPRPPRRPRHTR